ncbi:hypothetical protein [Nocardia higoensis]|uniref:hypothetical protein n=1 Tax=Nocardia higoensis TaxID=228599 RepID=UPI000302D6B9|nr:hypothetical protein [Nocardia higoensis]
MSALPEYPLSLAIEDYVPVVLTTCAVLLLRRITGSGRAAVAAGLIGAGGLAKATAKLVVAAGGPDLPWLRGALFPLLTLGFALLYVDLVGAATGRIRPRLLVGALALIAVCAAGAAVLGDALLMLVSTTVFATLTGIHLIRLARRRGDGLSAALIGLQLTAFFVLGALGARPEQPIALQWVEQLSNTAAQAAFLLAVVRLTSKPAEPGIPEPLLAAEHLPGRCQ